MNHSTHATSWRRWTLIGLILALGLNVAIRWHLRAMPLERDEGEYAYAGQLILQGILPYKLAFNMKFPGVYFMYAFLMAIFGQSTAGIHIGIFVVTSVTAVLIFLIGRELLADSGALIAAIIYICLAALPKAAGLAGHATHFVSLFVCAGVWALLMGRKGKPNPWWFVSGLAFGLAILMKQHAVFFPFFILVWFLWNCFRKEAAQKVIFSAILFCAGCVAPFLASAITFARAGLWHAFIFWTFDYARQYVSMLPLRAAPGQFVAGFDPVFESGIWPWLFGVAGLICSAWAKGNLWHSTLPAMAPATAGAHPHSQASDEAPPAIRDWRSALPTLVFLAGWAAVVPGFYFRNHY
ncbi:MAG: ArnT family glycosyltransferase, partial [Limisphaerales bacterium]